MRHIDIHDLAEMSGGELGVSEWHPITQERVNLFAEATGDHQWIHLDVERATAELGAPIAHGYLTLSLIPMLVAEAFVLEGVTHGLNYGADRVRFVTPVPVGSRLRARVVVLDVASKSNGLLVRLQNTVEIDGQPRPACVAETLTLWSPAAVG
jgi:acyl dehydratase